MRCANVGKMGVIDESSIIPALQALIGVLVTIAVVTGLVISIIRRQLWFVLSFATGALGFVFSPLATVFIVFALPNQLVTDWYWISSLLTSLFMLLAIVFAVVGLYKLAPKT